MAYTVLVNDDNSVSVRYPQRIMQRSKLVDGLRLIVSKYYNDISMTDCVAILESTTPISKSYDYMELDIENENYKEKEFISYLVPIDTNWTMENGDLELKLHFIQVTMNETGNVSTFVRQIDPFTIKIIPVEDWFRDPDSALATLDQRIIAMQEVQKAMLDTADILMNAKADDIKLDGNTSELYLTSNGKKVGNAIALNDLGEEISEATASGLVKMNR